jgi:hypothetical protein
VKLFNQEIDIIMGDQAGPPGTTNYKLNATATWIKHNDQWYYNEFITDGYRQNALGFIWWLDMCTDEENVLWLISQLMPWT